MYRIIYFIRAAVENMVRNLMVNLISTATIALALIIFGSFLLLNNNLQKLTAATTKDLTVSVYLKDDLSPRAVDLLKSRLADLPEVKSVTYIDQDQALADLKRRLGELSGALEGLDENPLPASFELEVAPTVQEGGRIRELVRLIKGENGVDEVYYAWEWADRLRAFIDFLRVVGYVIGGLLFAAIVFIISNTIRLTVLTRREELYILRLMGATETFVRTPFIIEGVVQGAVGGLAALLGALALFWIVSSNLALPVGFAEVHLTFLSASQAWSLPLVGAVLGFAGSFLSMGRLRQA